MTSTRRTDHDRVRHQPDDSDSRWPLRGDLAYDTATSRTGVVIDFPSDTGITFYRLCPEGGGAGGWTASRDTLVPTEDPPRDARQGEPSPELLGRALVGWERFLGTNGPSDG